MKILLKVLINGLIHLTVIKVIPIGINKRVIGKLKDELGGKIMIEFSAHRAKTYSFLLNDDIEKKRVKDTKKCIIKRKIIFEHSKDCLFNDKAVIKSQLKNTNI